MKIIRDINDLPLNEKLAITIGNFDGMHLGHQALLKELAFSNLKKLIITFEPHPSKFLYPNKKRQKLSSNEQKIKLISKYNIDYLLILPFDEKIAYLTAEEFLRRFNVSCFILGPNATIGKDKKKSFANIQTKVVKQVLLNDIPISSSLIRNLIASGNLALANKMLNRNYSLSGKIIDGEKIASSIGFPTINVDISNKCLPPFGVYTIELIHNDKKTPGIANIGIAPTIKQKTKPILEVHLPNKSIANLSHAEVLLHHFLRPEKQFASTSHLKQQINEDLLFLTDKK